MTRIRFLALALLSGALMLLATACGGGDDDSGGGGDGGSGSGDSGSSQSAGGGGASSGGEGTSVGAPTLTADPGQTWAEVEGERLVYEANGSQHYECQVGPDRIVINYQTGDGQDFLLQASQQGDGWIGSMTFVPGDGNVQYGGQIPTDARALGIGEGAFSFEGTVSKVVDFDVANAETVDASIAVNCASAGGEPTATIDGQTYTFPASGAQSYDCSIGDESAEVLINRLAADDSQLEISINRRTPEAWLGFVAVYEGDARYTATVPEDGTGLAFDGSTVTFEGVFEEAAGGEFEGSVEVTCP